MALGALVGCGVACGMCMNRCFFWNDIARHNVFSAGMDQLEVWHTWVFGDSLLHITSPPLSSLGCLAMGECVSHRLLKPSKRLASLYRLDCCREVILPAVRVGCTRCGVGPTQ